MIYELNKDLARRWVAALRSGEYQQCKGQLGRTRAGESEYCCLGVLCEVAESELDAPTRRVDDADAGGWRNVSYDFAGSMPPSPVRELLGVKTFLVSVPAERIAEYWADDDGDGFVRVSLDVLNDEVGWTFKEIADLIEEVYELAEVTV